MSSRATGEVFARFPAGGGLFALALAIADHAWDDGTHVLAGVASLAVKSRQSERSVQYQLRKLVEMGWLQPVNTGDCGRGQYREYRINPHWLKGANLAPFSESEASAESAVDKASCAVDSADGKGANGDTKGCNPRHPYITVLTTNTPLPPNGGAQVDAIEPEAGGLAERFARFWAAYPRKEAEARARRRFMRIAPDEALLARMLAAVADQASGEPWKREGGRFVPLASTWLREERWKDRRGIDASAGEWWLSLDGVMAMGRQLGLAFDAAAFDRCLSVAERDACQRRYWQAVLDAAGPGPWSAVVRAA